MQIYQLYSEDEAKGIADKIRDLSWSIGKARTEKSTGTVKKNLELQHGDGDLPKELLEDMKSRLETHDLVSNNFVRYVMMPKFNRYQNGGTYHRHADAALMGGVLRTDLACTVFLTDDYEGGELCMDGVSVKGKPGQCVVYECWRPHWVTPVTKGERISAITWMESLLPDVGHREIALLFAKTLGKLEGHEAYGNLSAIHNKLLRMWIS